MNSLHVKYKNLFTYDNMSLDHVFVTATHEPTGIAVTKVSRLSLLHAENEAVEELEKIVDLWYDLNE